MVRSYTYGVARGMAMKFGSALTRLGGKRGDVMGMVRITHISDVPGSRIHDPVVTPCVGAAQHPRVPHRLPRRSWSWHHRHHSQSNIQVAPLHVVQHAPPNFLMHFIACQLLFLTELRKLLASLSSLGPSLSSPLPCFSLMSNR